MNLAWAYSTYLPWIETEMRMVVCSGDERVSGHYGMMQYHMGWVDGSFDPISAHSGKRIRPLLCLLACAAAGGDPRMALPAAAGLELLHNFSLIHDDIEDYSPNRRHRPTVWKMFGMPQACNAGDGMFSLAHLAFHRLGDLGAEARIVIEALRLFDQTCLSLTEGQYLDIAFESRTDVTEAEYVRMIGGKTGALLAASPQIGAVVAGAPADQVGLYHAFGAAMGRAFQLRDDILGIWGDEATTGKSVASDILSKKKSLPIILALAHPTTGLRMSHLYAGPPFEEADVPAIFALLDASGARSHVEEQIRVSVAEAQSALTSLQPHGQCVFLAILAELLESLIERVC
jgi:geranylgeranyl diphosphate synthase, type I